MTVVAMSLSRPSLVKHTLDRIFIVAPPLVSGASGHVRITASAAPLPGTMSTPPGFVEPYPGWAQEDNRPEILGIAGGMIVLAFLFVTARIYCRRISVGRLGIDDYIIVFSIVGGALPETG